MKIYKRLEFLKLPEMTFYAKCTVPWCFDNLCIKHDSLDFNDFVEQSLVDVESNNSSEHSERLERMLECGESFPINDTCGRDGCFEDDAIFMVYEKEDLLKIKKWVEEAMLACGESHE